MSHETRMERLGLASLIGESPEKIINALDNLPKKNGKLMGFDAIQWTCDIEITKKEVMERLPR